MWNPELVAKLEAERAQLSPKRIPTDTPEEIEKRRQIAEEIAFIPYRKANGGLVQRGR